MVRCRRVPLLLPFAAVLAICVVSVAVCLFYLSNGHQLVHQPGNKFETGSALHHGREPGNSATGRVFIGEKQREYTGTLLFAGSATADRPDRPASRGVAGSATKNCDKWSVVTTIFQPSNAVKTAAKVPGWCMVIVADNKTPADYLKSSGLQGTPHVVLLTVEMQREMELNGDEFVRATPWNHFARKNVGFLYAIRHGAKFIFDFDDDNELRSNDDGAGLAEQSPMSPLPDGNERELAALRELQPGPMILNPYPLMEPSVDGTWPRGFPLELIKDETTRGITEGTTALAMEHVAVVQSCADHDPDIDAVYRLTRTIPFTFKPSRQAQGLLVPRGAYAPYNAQATVHTVNALWATYLPVSSTASKLARVALQYLIACMQPRCL